jgi:CheY-like chemotaxis protein
MAKILVIDDTKAIADIVKNILDKEGHTATAAYNGREGIKNLTPQSAFDLVITDIIMPEQDGFDVIKHVKANLPKTKIIVMTGGGVAISPQQVIRSIGNDIDIFLTKPIGKADLLDAVNKALG